MSDKKFDGSVPQGDPRFAAATIVYEDTSGNWGSDGFGGHVPQGDYRYVTGPTVVDVDALPIKIYAKNIKFYSMSELNDNTILRSQVSNVSIKGQEYF